MRFKQLSLRILILLFVSTSHAYSQQSNLSKGVNYLSEFIASEYFLELKKENTDLALVDSIYIRAIKFYENDYQEALLALTFTTIPYQQSSNCNSIAKSQIILSVDFCRRLHCESQK